MDGVVILEVIVGDIARVGLFFWGVAGAIVFDGFTIDLVICRVGVSDVQETVNSIKKTNIRFRFNVIVSSQQAN